MKRQCDVLIIGAGMGGGCLARQLKLAMPDLRIVVIEKKKEFDYWIGESTVEVWTDYAYRLCGLGPYLHKNQDLKTGLRFFFDSKEKDLSVTEMSENGRAGYVSDICSHQLDRATFDRDLCGLNREIGIEVLLGTGVKRGPDGSALISIDPEGGHVVESDQGTIECRWLVDAGGRSAPLAQKLKLAQPDPRHPAGSYWGRFSGYKSIDEIGDEGWRRKVENTLRILSTNHFMYPGYWIWTIPVTDKILSIGVCYRKDIQPLKMRNVEDFLAFLRGHKCFREMLPETTRAHDFMSFGDCTRHAKLFYSTDRWFLTGMSGFVIDALFSTTGQTTAFSNRMIGEMIRTDRSGDKALFARQVRHFNIHMQTLYEHIMRIVSRYEEFGSFDSWTGWRIAVQSSYFNTAVPSSTEDMKTLFDMVRSHPDECGCTLEKSLQKQDRGVVAVADRLLREMHAYLVGNGRYFDGNRGGFTEAEPRVSLSRKLWRPRDARQEHLENLVSYETSYRNFLSRMAVYEGVPWNENAFLRFFERDWNSGQTLAMGLEALRKAPRKPRKLMSDVRWNYKGPLDEYGEELPPERLFRDPVYAASPRLAAASKAVKGHKKKKAA